MCGIYVVSELMFMHSINMGSLLLLLSVSLSFSPLSLSFPLKLSLTLCFLSLSLSLSLFSVSLTQLSWSMPHKSAKKGTHSIRFFDDEGAAVIRKVCDAPIVYVPTCSERLLTCRG